MVGPSSPRRWTGKPLTCRQAVIWTAIGVSLLWLLILSVSSDAGNDDPDCADYLTQKTAQAVYDADRSDPYRLDADRDGIPCETLPR